MCGRCFGALLSALASTSACTPHGLRHTHAAELAAEGVPSTVIRDQLGHSNLSTTDRYLRHVAPQEVLRAMRRREWEPNAATGGP